MNIDPDQEKQDELYREIKGGEYQKEQDKKTHNALNSIFGMFDNKKLHNYFVDENKIVECKNPFGCGWQGKLLETKEIEVNSPRSAWVALAGREGYEYRCPKCNKIVYSHYTKVS